MSMIYDNWERLVAAVLKREEIWEICHAHSRSSSLISSISSDFTSSSSFYFDDDFRSVEESTHRSESEWVEEYEAAMYLMLADSVDGSIEVERARPRLRKTFNEKVAKTWSNNSKRKVDMKHKDPNEVISLGRNELLPLLKTKFDKNIRSRNSEIVSEWVEHYEPGVYVTLGALKDGTRDVILVGFRWRKFKVHEAEAWWHNNQENVYQKYNALSKLTRIRQSSRVKETGDLTVVEWIEVHEFREANRVLLRQDASPRLSLLEYNGMPSLTLVKDPILEINFDEILRSANLDGPIGKSNQSERIEAIDRYEPGVYLSLEYSEDWISDVERVRFSRNIFKRHEAVAWWIKNRENVYRKHRIRMP